MAGARSTRGATTNVQDQAGQTTGPNAVQIDDTGDTSGLAAQMASLMQNSDNQQEAFNTLVSEMMGRLDTLQTQVDDDINVSEDSTQQSAARTPFRSSFGELPSIEARFSFVDPIPDVQRDIISPLVYGEDGRRQLLPDHSR
jgi:hypothetical protein